ncbi:YrhK family protein [Marivita sp. GX14005]|uniref:YrhK family protein n=1 Tax=Marivita sp. GX14005 TaxID=2942276 RepID=UPI002018CE86|nr:YrhK family protein [Marivita sp. GX14005]MCL3882142.1 YrhK family protein [Marivita sp. GX14005]
MKLFRLSNRERNERSKDIYAAYELAYTIVEFGAAISFLIGSILFFWKEYETPALWLFVIGSLLFAAKPTIRFAREIKLASEGDVDDLAERYGG